MILLRGNFSLLWEISSVNPDAYVRNIWLSNQPFKFHWQFAPQASPTSSSYGHNEQFISTNQFRLKLLDFQSHILLSLKWKKTKIIYSCLKVSNWWSANWMSRKHQLLLSFPQRLPLPNFPALMASSASSTARFLICCRNCPNILPVPLAHSSSPTSTEHNDATDGGSWCV